MPEVIDLCTDLCTGSSEEDPIRLEEDVIDLCEDTPGTWQNQVHFKGVLNTSALKEKVEAAFGGIRRDARPTFRFMGRDGFRFNRDAIWYATPDADGRWPLYRVYSSAYGSPNTRAGMRDVTEPELMPPWMRRLLDTVAAQHGLPRLNHVVLHRYLDGGDYISPHHDKWMDIQPGSSIVSLSIGSSRRFVLLKDDVQVDAFPVCDGDAVILPYAINQRLKHGIPATRSGVGVRYSITARSIDTQYSPAECKLWHRESSEPLSY